jgi:hypothetical protein
MRDRHSHSHRNVSGLNRKTERAGPRRADQEVVIKMRIQPNQMAILRTTIKFCKHLVRPVIEPLRSSRTIKKLRIYAQYYAFIVYYKVLSPRRSVFQSIYERRTWGNRSASGGGSDLELTVSVRSALPALLEKFDVHSLLDAPCGDFNWMAHVLLDVERYIGMDIVPELIDHAQNYASDKFHFICGDIITSDLPRVDLILCRDCLVHLSYNQIFACLANFRRSGSTYLLTTTFPGQVRRHWNIMTGMWRPLDLQLPPFSFPMPLCLLQEDVPETELFASNKCLGLWKLSELPKHYQ